MVAVHHTSTLSYMPFSSKADNAIKHSPVTSSSSGRPVRLMILPLGLIEASAYDFAFRKCVRIGSRVLKCGSNGMRKLRADLMFTLGFCNELQMAPASIS